MEIQQLKTPALVLDKSRLMANASRMTQRIHGHGIKLRPHMKTCKSIDVARLMLQDNFGGVTVSTLAEALYFFRHGIVDITLAVAIVPAKLDEVAALNAQGAEINIITDDPGVARAIAEHAGPHRVLIEIDCGEHRTGLSPTSTQIDEIARLITAAPTAAFVGVFTHAGHSYGGRKPEQMAAIAEAERQAVVSVAERLRASGIAVATVSVGSTPTATYAKSMDGLTETRPGVYGFYDLFQAGISSCSTDDLAVTVLASVIGHHREANELLLDAGGLALSKDRSTQALDQDCGYGLVCDALSVKPIPGMKVEHVHQEHGLIKSLTPIDFDHFAIGSLVRVMPNHVCMTAAAYDKYHVVEGAAEHPEDIVAVWQRCNGW